MGGAGSFALIVLLGYLISRKAEISDPPEFIEALKTWTEVITIKNRTPRHYKRAVNQLRLLAMRMDEDSSNANPESKNKQMVRFVVLKALRELGVDAQKILGIVKRKKSPSALKADFKKNINLTDGNRTTDDYAEVLSQAVARHHRGRFKEQWPIRTDIKHYDDLMQGITLH